MLGKNTQRAGEDSNVLVLELALLVDILYVMRMIRQNKGFRRLLADRRSDRKEEVEHEEEDKDEEADDKA